MLIICSSAIIAAGVGQVRLACKAYLLLPSIFKVITTSCLVMGLFFLLLLINACIDVVSDGCPATNWNLLIILARSWWRVENRCLLFAEVLIPFKHRMAECEPLELPPLFVPLPLLPWLPVYFWRCCSPSFVFLFTLLLSLLRSRKGGFQFCRLWCCWITVVQHKFASFK